ncbi:acyltransferase [Paenarthrobacter sp. DKR-5]|uniref:acyltransferase family protein n=1 Tax=Paenarthrobacter sp. DKR-5 TaxID=2835535 RepID=UPI001BDD8CEC|nr:acyltransferase family protein [Paenarthrobacter sp. DKR-5]MBT1001014.1 acyltransferase [Paenarthrobacter sp. DKR-5]
MAVGQALRPHPDETPVPEGRKKPRPKPPPGFLPEVQGLRSLAVLMVVVYHVWLGRVSGGVDIFLLISAFLMTSQFVRRYDRDEPMALAKHWLHLFKRLLPISVVVILAVLGASWLIVPPTRWDAILGEAWASLLYFENWALGANAVNYYAADDSLSSPFQHFWSLSIQGQVFILWPLIFAGAALLARRTAWGARLTYRWLLAGIFAVIFAVSLIFSVSETNSNQAFAYFDTRARLWEFALGSLLALALPHLKLPRGLRIFLGWFGVVAMVSCGIILQVQQQFPGYVALWPTLAAACIIVAGQTASPAGADRLLSSRPLVYLGNNSYGLYLWHWPLLILVLIWSDRDRAGLLDGLAIIVTAIILAILATRFVETPVRKWKWAETSRLRAAAVIAVCVSLVAAPVALWQSQLADKASRAQAQAVNDNPGALSLLPGYVNRISADAVTIPAAATVAEDFPRLPGQCTDDLEPDSEVVKAACSVQPAAGTPKKTVVVVGNSHARQLSTAVLAMGKQQNWTVVNVTSMGCVFAPDDAGQSTDCGRFYQDANSYIAKIKPAAVFTIVTKTEKASPAEVTIPGMEQTVGAWTKAGIDVVGVRDNPRFPQNMPECAAAHPKDPGACTQPIDSVLPSASPMDGFLSGNKKFFAVDLTDLLCPGAICPAVIGNVFVYFDDNHVSQAYWKTMAGEFGRRVFALTGWH